MKTISRLWIAILVMVLLSPIGLILSDRFKTGPAWGEWEAARVQKLVGYTPQGLQKFSRLWTAPLPDYAFKGWSEKGLPRLGFAAILSGIVGSGLTAALISVIGYFIVKKNG